MRKLLMILVIASLSFQVKAQAVSLANVPTTIRTGFTQQFGAAAVTDMSWMTYNKGYAATFTKDGETHFVEYDAENKLLDHRRTAKESELPASITTYIKTNYPNHKIEEVDWHEKDGKASYEIEIEGKPDYELFFDTMGKLLLRELD